MIAARYSAAEAQVQINQSLGGVSRELADLGAALQQAEARTADMQARASAIDELVEAGVLDVTPEANQVAAELRQLDVGSVVDSELDALKSVLRAGTI